MKRILVLVAVGLLAVSGTVTATTFTAISASYSAAAGFVISGNTLTITLTNLSAQSSGWDNADLLTALFFDFDGNPALSLGAANVATGSTRPSVPT